MLLRSTLLWYCSVVWSLCTGPEDSSECWRLPQVCLQVLSLTKQTHAPTPYGVVIIGLCSLYRRWLWSQASSEQSDGVEMGEHHAATWVAAVLLTSQCGMPHVTCTCYIAVKGNGTVTCSTCVCCGECRGCGQLYQSGVVRLWVWVGVWALFGVLFRTWMIDKLTYPLSSEYQLGDALHLQPHCSPEGGGSREWVVMG